MEITKHNSLQIIQKYIISYSRGNNKLSHDQSLQKISFFAKKFKTN